MRVIVLGGIRRFSDRIGSPELVATPIRQSDEVTPAGECRSLVRSSTNSEAIRSFNKRVRKWHQLFADFPG
jgi:hypothetical protein